MKRLRLLVDALPGLIILGLIVATLYLGGRALARQVADLDTTLFAALVAAVVTVFGYLYSAWQTKSREISESHRAAKVQVYEKFFDIIEIIQKTPSQPPAPARGTSSADPELLQIFVKFTRGLIAWGGPGVIRAWLKFRAQNHTTVNTLLGVDDVLRAIRKDLGNSNRALKRGDLVKCFLKDPEELEALVRKQAGKLDVKS